MAEALEAARRIENERYQAEALAALVPHLPEGQRAQVLTEALAAARRIEDEEARAEALAALAPHLPEDLLARALDVARALPAWTLGLRSPRADALAALAPHLPEGLLAEALAAARGIESGEARAKALAALAPRLAELPLPELYPLWREILPIPARRTRKDLLADIRALHPVIAQLGGPEALRETAQAILDVARWWP